MARGEILPADAQPTADPDLDGVGLGQGPLDRRLIGRMTFGCDWHVQT